MKKKIIMALVLAGALAFAAACGNGDEPTTATEATTEATTAAPTTEAPTEATTEEVTEAETEPETEPEPEPEPFVAAPTPPGYIWSLSRDASIQNLAQGTLGTGEDLLYYTDFIQAAGSPVFGVEASPFGGNALSLQFRTENWHALDIYTQALGLNLASNQYHIVIQGSVAEPDGTTVILGGADSPWNWFLTATPSESGAFTIAGVISQETLDATGAPEQFDRCFRIQTNNFVDFTVYEIIITQAPINHVWSLSRDFRIQALAAGAVGTGSDILGATPFIQEAGSPTFFVVDGPYGNAVQVAFRTENWHALDISTPAHGFNFDENEYQIRIAGRVADVDGTQVILGGADSPWNWFLNTEPNEDGTFEIEGIISRETMEATDGGSEQFERCFRIQTNNFTDLTLYEISIVRL